MGYLSIIRIDVQDVPVRDVIIAIVTLVVAIVAGLVVCCFVGRRQR